MKMITCQVCGNKNIEGSQYCDECGSGLGVSDRGESEGIGPAGFQSVSSETPGYRSSSNVTSVGIPVLEADAAKSHGTADRVNHNEKRGAHADLLIERGEASGTRFTLYSDEAYIGRWDADNGIFPDVDLDAYDTEAKVSRRHARITRRNGSYSIEDLGSTNGTYVNRGRRLIPGNAHVLKDGDEIIVGKIFLRFNVSDNAN